MLTDEDIDCQVQDISDAGGAPLGSIEKPFAIDAIQKHVEESLLFLDEEKSENKTGSTYQQTNVVLEKSGSGSDDTIMQDVDDNSKAGEPQKSSAVILKQENLHVKQETINIPKQVETNDVILSLEDNLVSDSVLKETNIDAMNSENKPSKLELEQSDSKACNVLQDDNRSSLSMLNETDIDATIYDSEFKSSDISEQSDASKVYNASQDNSSFSNMLNETNTDAEKNNYVKEKTSDISMVLHERVSRSDSLLDETDVDRTMNYESQEEFGDSSKQMTNNEISSVSSEQKSPSDSLLAQECIIGSPQQTDEMVGSKSSIVPQEENRTSEVLLEEADTVAAISGFQEETINISEEIDSNEISNISKVDNNLLNESNTDAAMKESLEIPEQIETQKVDTIYKVHNAINTDVTINDSQEEIIDLTELIDSTDVSMVSQENLSSDSVLNITDEALNDTQEKNDDSETYNIDDSTISEKYSGPSVMELDKTNIVLHEGYETDSKTIETVGNCQDNLKSIKKADHENSVPQEGGILIESKEHNNQTDEPTQGIENTTREDKDHDKLPKLESNVEKSSLPEDKTHVMNEVIKTEQATEKSQEKELVWEVKPIKHELEQNVTENPTKKNPLVRAAPTEDVTECPPTKRPRSQPVWTTNPIYDEDKPKAEQGTCSSKSDNTATDKPANDTKADDPLKPYIISQEEKKQLKTWLVKSGLVPKEKFKCVLNIINGAKMNKAVLKMAPIPKDYKPMDVLRVIRDQTKVYEKDITKDIQFIHIGKHDDKFNAAYIKWRDIQKLLVVKAHSILATKSFIVDGLVQQPLFEYDDRSIIDWNENDRPIIKQKDGDIEIPTTVSTPALTPVVTTIATVAATNSSVAATVATVVAKPRYKKPPPAPFTTGQMNVKDKKTFGLSPAFINYYNLKPPIVSFVFISNLDTSHSVESYHKIFGAAGEILEIEVLPPPNDEQPSLKLRISYNHPLEAVQAISMFHEQILFNRLIQVEIGDLSMKKKLFNIEGFDNIGPGLGTNGFIMLNIRSNIELSKFKARTKIEMDNLRVKISSLRHKLASTVYKMDQAKRDEEKRRYKEEKRHTQNKTQNKQSNMDAVNAITTAIASSVQANVISMLGMKQDQNVKQNTPPTPAKPHAPASNQPVGISQRQNTSRAPVNWTAKENPIALPTTTLPTTILPTTALPTTARQNRNMPSQTSMGHPFQNLGSELHGYQNPLDPYSYYASMQQAYAQYGYAMDPTLMQAYVQPGLPYMQPGIVNVQPVPPIANLQPVPAINTSNMPLTAPKTQSMPTIISNQPGPSKPSNPTQTKVHTQSKTIFPPLTTNKTGTVYEVQKPLPRFDLPPANAGNTTATNLFDVAPGTGWQTTVAENKVQEIPLPIPTISQTSVKTAFKTQKPIVPPKVTKPLSINMKIPSVLPEAVPLVLQNPRTQEKNSVQQKFTTMAGKVSSVPWINKQIKEMRRNSKSPERIRKSPEKIKSPDWSQNALLPPKAVRRMSRSPERRNSRSPIRRRSRSAERRRVSRSPKRRMSRSPIRRRSRSPIRRRSRSPVRRRSIERRRMSRSPKRRMSRSPKRRSSRSPIRRKSKSPIRRRSRSPKRRISRSPRKRISKSPVRSMPPSEIGKADRLQSSELGPKSTPRPAYEPDGASRVKTNVDLDFNYMAREIANTAVNFSYLPPSVATEDLTDKMCEIGELLEVRALGMGKAKVVFKFRHDAETCIEMYNKAKVDGQMIQVRWASIE